MIIKIIKRKINSYNITKKLSTTKGKTMFRLLTVLMLSFSLFTACEGKKKEKEEDPVECEMEMPEASEDMAGDEEEEPCELEEGCEEVDSEMPEEEPEPDMDPEPEEEPEEMPDEMDMEMPEEDPMPEPDMELPPECPEGQEC